MNGVVKLVPVPNEVPPVGAAYQFNVPPDAVAPNSTVPAPVLVPGVVPVTDTDCVMVSVLVETALPQGALAYEVNVSVTLPAAISAALGV